MAYVAANDVVNHLQWRYATKKFDASKTISDQDWQALEQSLILAPSSYGLQPWKFYVVTDPVLKAQMPEISWGQNQPRECSHMVLFAQRSKLGEKEIEQFLNRVAQVRGTSIESMEGYRRMMVSNLTSATMDIGTWAKCQVYIALGQFMACAAMMGIDTCPMEGILPDRYDQLLGAQDEGFNVVVGCAAGYRDEGDKYASMAKVRFEASQVVRAF